LTQWHVHNLCLKPGTLTGGKPRPDGSCPANFERPKDSVPMIHVWIVPRPCGPFSALEGTVGEAREGGQDLRCDRLHGEDTEH
jgi:hypothetical protein